MNGIIFETECYFDHYNQVFGDVNEKVVVVDDDVKVKLSGGKGDLSSL